MLQAKEHTMTLTSKVVAVTLVVMAGVVLSGRASSAEWFADVYSGASVTRDHDVTVHDRGAGLGVYRDAEFATSLAYGARLGHYFDDLPFVGLAADLFSFSPNIRPQAARRDGCFLVTGCGSGESRTGRIDIDTRALSLDLMLRLPLFKTTEEPHGVLQPYVAVGVPLFFTTVTPRSTRPFHNQDDETDVSLGYKAAAGVAFRVYTNLDLFGEYRYTHTSTSVDLRDAVIRKASFDTDLDTHSFLLGISARW
jgi:opacity protein-like surface antigen